MRAVPRPFLALLGAGLAAQIAWHAARPDPEAHAQALPPPPSPAALAVAALGDEPVLAKLLMLWLQAHDYQPGISIPFARLDYARVEAWLGRILDLDPRARYPLLAAARLYGAVSDEARARRMFEFVHRRFLEAPNERWQWLAHAALMAKHRLDDPRLALRYARAITEHATGPGVPAWARDMSALILEDLGEYEAAYVLVRALVESGRVSDPAEIRFLQRKLDELEAKMGEGGGDAIPAPSAGG